MAGTTRESIERSGLRKRQRFGFLLAGIAAAGYAALILVMAFMPDLLARPVAPGRALTTGLLWSFAYAVLTIVVMGLYVMRRSSAGDRGRADG